MKTRSHFKKVAGVGLAVLAAATLSACGTNFNGGSKSLASATAVVAHAPANR